MFLIIVRISKIYLFPLEPLIINSKMAHNWFYLFTTTTVCSTQSVHETSGIETCRADNRHLHETSA
jgi:hypothetical protein